MWFETSLGKYAILKKPVTKKKKKKRAGEVAQGVGSEFKP
jgi:hypothetical protein